MKWGSAAPIFRVEDVHASRDYYVNVLGFQTDWEYDEIISVSRGECNIFLCQGDQTSGRTWVWIGVSDVEEVERELRSKGAHIRQPPTNFSWALEMQVMDLDGNVLRVGSEPKAGKYGPWLDAHGNLWYPQPNGTWTTTPPEVAPMIN